MKTSFLPQHWQHIKWQGLRSQVVFFSIFPFICAGLSDRDQGFRPWDEQRDGQSRRPHYAFCCTGSISHLTGPKNQRCCRWEKLLITLLKRAQVMLESSVYLALSVYCCCCLLAAFASCALPIETTGRGLQESSQRGGEWGQEMVGRAGPPGSERIPQSSSGSQGWGTSARGVQNWQHSPML